MEPKSRKNNYVSVVTAQCRGGRVRRICCNPQLLQALVLRPVERCDPSAKAHQALPRSLPQSCALLAGVSETTKSLVPLARHAEPHGIG